MLHKNLVFGANDLKDKDFNGDIFIHCDFAKVDFKFVAFSNCRFENCNFSGGILNITSFYKCAFPETKLSNIDFADTKLEKCDFAKAVMENCVFQQLKSGNKSLRKEFNLRECHFTNTDLAHSAFVWCNLTEVEFNSTKLTQVVFEKCNLTQVNFTGADLEGTGFENCKIQSTILDVGGFISLGSSRGFVLYEDKK